MARRKWTGGERDGRYNTVLKMSTVQDAVAEALFPAEKLKDVSNSEKLNGANGGRERSTQRSTMQTQPRGGGSQAAIIIHFSVFIASVSA